MDSSNQPNSEPRLRSLYRIRSPHGWEFEASSIEGHTLALEWFEKLSPLPIQPTPAPFAYPFPATHPIAFSHAVPGQSSNGEGSSVPLSTWVKEYMELYLPSSTKLNKKGQKEAASSLNLFIKVVGDKPLGAVTTKDGQRFVSTLNKWPAHSSKKPEFRDLQSVEDVLRVAKELDAPALSPVTVLNRTNYVQAFFTWLQRRQEIRFDPFYGVILPDAVAKLTRIPFSDDDIQVIFDREKRVWADTPHDFWAPIIAYYTGARVREIGQLYVDDIETIQGVPVIHISARFPGQQVKTDGSERAIPIRQELIGLGFLQYVQDIKAMGHKLLFPYTTWTTGDAGRPIARPFNEMYLRVICEITDPAKSFHCFRHLFSTQAERSGLTDGRISQLTGHKLENVSALRTNYIQAATLPQRYADIHLIDLPVLDVEKYRTGQFDRYFQDKEREALREKLKESREGEAAATQDMPRRAQC